MSEVRFRKISVNTHVHQSHIRELVIKFFFFISCILI